MTSYQISQEVNLQTMLWAVAGAVWTLVRLVATAAGWVVATVAKALPTVLAAGKVLGVTLGWVALIIGAVVLAALYWHVVLCGLLIAGYAWWFKP